MEPVPGKHHLLIEHLPYAFAYHQLVTDHEGKPVDYIFLDVNPAFEEMTGLTREKIIGKKVTQILPGISDSGFDWIGTYGKVALTGESICFEQYSEPLERWYAITAYSDEPGFFAVIFRGITQNKKAEDALKFQNIILKTQQEVSLDGIVIVDEYDKVISFNQRFADIWEIPDDIMSSQSGEKALNFVLPKLINPEEFANRINYLNENKQEQSYEEIALADGRTLERYSAPMFSHDEHYYGRVWYYRDITERKQVEEALRQSEEKFRQMADNVGEVFWLRSSDNSKMLYVNKAYEEIWGRPRERLYVNQAEFLEAIHDEDREKVLAEYEQYMGNKLFNLEYRVVQPGGAVKWVWARSFPVRGDGGKIVSHTGIAVDITARKQVEEALQEKEEYLRGILESQLDLVVRVDHEGRFLYVNEAYCKVFGKTRDELLGKQFAPLVHPDDLPGTMQAMENLYVPPYRAYIEQRAKTTRGWRWLAWQDYAIRDISGTITEIQGVGKDITDQKEAEARLKAEAEKYQTILATTRDGFWITDLQGRILEVNDAYCQMSGYTRQELLSMSILEIEAAELPTETAEHIQIILQNGSDLFETRHQGKDGRSIDFEISVTYLDTNGGRLIVFLRDITERKHGEKRLRESEERFRRIFDEGPLGMALVNPDSRFLMVNDELCRMLGYQRQELLELRLFDVTNTEDHFLYMEQLRELAEGKKHTSQIEFRLARQSGESIWVSLTKTSIHDQSEISHYYLTMIEDITERIQTLDKLAEYTTKTEMANLELENARDIALAASRAKSDFLSVMSHEIRTPMNSIMGMADLLAETPLTAEQSEYVRTFRGAGETLLGLINDILDLSKIEAGHLELEEHDFDLSELLLRTTGLLGLKAKEKGLKLSYSIMPGVPLLLRGDEGRLQQIILNLLGNAVKFTNEGEINLTVEEYSPHPDADTEEAGETTEEEVKLLFAVADTGIGIPEERLDAVFKEFTQVDSSVTRQYGGTGLGLTISRRLAERLGGSIWVESLQGLGSTFYFTVVFRIAQGEAEAASAAAVTGMGKKPERATPEHATTEQTEAKSLHILLVEDNADNRLLIKAFLRKTPHRLSIAEDGAEAVHKVKETNYDLVLMDVQMPVMDGYTATGEIRRWEREEGKDPLPIIALTAHALREEVQKALDAGCNAHLAKPVKKDVLIRTITDYGNK